MQARHIMSRTVVTVELYDSLGQIREISDHSHFHHLPGYACRYP